MANRPTFHIAFTSKAAASIFAIDIKALPCLYLEEIEHSKETSVFEVKLSDISGPGKADISAWKVCKVSVQSAILSQL